MLLPHSRKPMKEVKICTQFSIESCIEDWMINSVCLLRQLINFLEWRKKRRYPETSAIFHPKSLRWSCICISFSLSTFTKHWFCRFWNPFENSTNSPARSVYIVLWRYPFFLPRKYGEYLRISLYPIWWGPQY